MERGNHSDGGRVMARCREKNMTEIGGGGWERERERERESKRALESEENVQRERAVKA